MLGQCCMFRLFAYKYWMNQIEILHLLEKNVFSLRYLIWVVTAQFPPPVFRVIQAPPVNERAIITFGGRFSIVDLCPALVSCDTLKSVHGTAVLTGQPNEPHWLPIQQTLPDPIVPPLLIVVWSQKKNPRRQACRCVNEIGTGFWFGIWGLTYENGRFNLSKPHFTLKSSETNYRFPSERTTTIMRCLCICVDEKKE